MQEINQFMNNRELVALVYLGLFFILVIALKNVRPSLVEVLKLLVTSKIGVMLGLYLATILTAIWSMSRLGLWTHSLLGNTILWIILIGLAWFININDAGKDSDFFKRRLLEALGISAFLEFFINLEAMPLVLEFISQAFLLFVVLLNAVAIREVKYQAVARLTSGILILGGLALLAYTIVELVRDWDTLNFQDILNQVLLPILLTIAVIPCLYLIGLTAGYESLFMRLSFLNDRRRPALPVLAGVISGLRGSLVDINEFGGRHTVPAARSTSFRAARSAVRAFKADRRADLAARAMARQRLIDNAGLIGTDSAGLQLDRREFAATKEALRWLATCHMGWYQRDDRPSTYRDDLLTILGDFSQQGLSEPHGIVMKVRKDGQAWYAWRETPSGYVFGIGASGAPPSQWYSDGPQPPRGYSSKKSGWTSSMEPDSPEWREEALT
jgi:hypothetical protein